ncbi:unnamed protein product, partial [Mesorhabditis belari]|uniref:DnaJ homologue subfamily C GRV2/DNAJC13 N-terminal domain-containing protein n=1 Tax=Mesorhabditis belari TaxID=2138241 RepID=A0AAF3ED87_9BILA
MDSLMQRIRKVSSPRTKEESLQWFECVLQEKYTKEDANAVHRVEAQLQCLRRLFASKSGFQAFMEVAGTREKLGDLVVRCLQWRNEAIDHAVVETLCALMRPMHNFLELRAEQLNKQRVSSDGSGGGPSTSAKPPTRQTISYHSSHCHQLPQPTPQPTPSIPATFHHVPDQQFISQHLQEILASSPAQLTRCGVLPRNGSAAEWEWWLCWLATALSPPQWQGYWAAHAAVFGGESVPVNELSFFSSPASVLLQSFAAQCAQQAYGGVTEASTNFFSTVPPSMSSLFTPLIYPPPLEQRIIEHQAESFSLSSIPISFIDPFPDHSAPHSPPFSDPSTSIYFTLPTFRAPAQSILTYLRFLNGKRGHDTGWWWEWSSSRRFLSTSITISSALW